MSDKITYETRTKGKGSVRFNVEQFAGWFARFQAIRHAKKVIKRGEASVATVFRVKRIGTFGK